MNKYSSLQDIIDAVLSLNLGITFFAHDKQKRIEIHDSHGKNFVKFEVSKNSYIEIIDYLAEKLDQPTIKKLQSGKVFEYTDSYTTCQAFRVSGENERYVFVDINAKPKFFNSAKELLDRIDPETKTQCWTEIK